MNSLTVSCSLLPLIAFVQAPTRYLLEMLKAESREIIVWRHLFKSSDCKAFKTRLTRSVIILVGLGLHHCYEKENKKDSSNPASHANRSKDTEKILSLISEEFIFRWGRIPQS
jgi:hypothetical protein